MKKMYDVHVSGHACQEELKIMMSITKPKYFIPVHGEQKHLRKNAGLAKSVGIPPQNILIADNGKEVELTEDKIRISGDVPAGMVFVDGSGVGDVRLGCAARQKATRRGRSYNYCRHNR